jgi:tetratricopeptide (TPR) repeat protein
MTAAPEAREIMPARAFEMPITPERYFHNMKTTQNTFDLMHSDNHRRLFAISHSSRFVAVATACLVVFAWGTLTPARTMAQGGGLPAEGVPEDDPFADELNPFGRGPKAPPEAAPAQPRMPKGQQAAPPRPAPQLPVPFPETTMPGDAAGRRPDRARVDPRGEASRGMSERDRRSDAWEPTPAEQLLIEAEKLDRAGKLEEARDKLHEVIKLDPRMTLAYLALGVTSRRLGDFEGSVDACSKGLEIDPQDSELYLRRGIAWFHLGLYGIALEDFEDAAGIAYDDPRPELWRGLTLIELDRPLEAINAYASSIRRDRTYMLAYLNRGLAYLNTGEPRKAEFDFNQAIRHDPRDVRAWFNRGVAQTRQGRFADAVNSYGEALKRDPKHEPSRRNVDVARSMIGREARPQP